MGPPRPMDHGAAHRFHTRSAATDVARNNEKLNSIKYITLFILLGSYIYPKITIMSTLCKSNLVGNSTPTGTQEKKMKSCKYVHPNIVSNVKICVDSKSAKENSVIYTGICLAGIGHSPEYPTKKHRCLIIYHIELIDVIEGHIIIYIYSSFYSTTYSILCCKTKLLEI